MAFYLGIDGGATKTKFLLGDEQQVLAEALGEGSNVLRSGEEAVRTALHTGIDEVCSRAGVQPGKIKRLVAGIAGSSNDGVRLFLQLALRQKCPAGGEVLGDMVIAHHAALTGAPGVLVNAGTGSIAYGRNTKDETARAGGWGIAISDEGSGDWIGRAAIATAMREFDARRDDEFMRHLMVSLGTRTPEDLARLANESANPNLGRLFPEVVSLALIGDTTAEGILVHAGQELAVLAGAVLDRLFHNAADVRVAATGGVFRSSDTVFQSFRSRVQILRRGATVFLSITDPAMGALQLARREP